MEAKQMIVRYGPVGNEQQVEVQLNGVPAGTPLTPKLAAQAARIACGHRNGVTVLSNEDDYGYRLYSQSARKLKFDTIHGP
jgi:hypothetical protein